MKVYLYDGSGYLGQFDCCDGQLVTSDDKIGLDLRRAAGMAADLAATRRTRIQAFSEPRSGHHFIVEVECQPSC